VRRLPLRDYKFKTEKERTSGTCSAPFLALRNGSHVSFSVIDVCEFFRRVATYIWCAAAPLRDVEGVEGNINSANKEISFVEVLLLLPTPSTKRGRRNAKIVIFREKLFLLRCSFSVSVG
jgi:hypothetical protein